MSSANEFEPVLRAYGGEAGDARVARRRAALIEAALDMLAQDDDGTVTVRGVCARAELTPRYFYESFPGIDDLVAAAYDGVIARITEQALGAFAAGDDSKDKVRGAVDAVVGVIESDRRVGRLLFADTVRSPVVSRKRAESTRLFVALTGDSAVEAVGVAPGPVTTAAAYFQVGGLGRLLAAWTEGEVQVDRTQLVDVCVHLLLGLGSLP
ncbi:TetR family transcriptional regulator [Gordonia alkaliphila]|uniref:TetR/AcrR family transcriptional regulator n=1 Tax=Gordonia alkaliphila TaxID=1053547 RepID=UPI001FF3638C|nr:TetR family transcriptional regulator [Gordonia alkaliphila]MCK0438883.1 TetR family transcriptional regulator [Gordonia alkaliphila]